MKVLHYDEPVATSVALEAEALIREARRRQRRRWALTALAVLFAAGLVSGLLVSLGGRGGSPLSGSRGPSSSRGLLPGNTMVRSVSFPGPFVPNQVVATSGAVWVLGADRPASGAGCSLERVNPATLRSRYFALPACGTYISVGGRAIYLAAGLPVPDSNSVRFHLERFDPLSGRATLLAPVMATAVGSDEAHISMAYGDRSIWVLSGDGMLRQVSPSTGRVVRTVPNGPSGSGDHQSLTVNAGGVWVAGGPGGGRDMLRMSPGSHRMSVVYRAPVRGSILWLSTVGDVVWADVATYGGTGGVDVSTKLIAFDLSGRMILRTQAQNFGDIPFVGGGGGLYSVGSGARCNAPQQLWTIDAKTGKATALTRLATPIEPCLTGQIGSAGSSVFVLENTGTTKPPAVLYRIDAKNR